MTRTYHSLPYRLDRADSYLIYISNDEDGLVTESDRTIPSFRDQEALRAYAIAHQIELDSMEKLLTDLDAVADWLPLPLSTEVDCDPLIVGWNLFGDIATSVGADFDPDRERTQRVYEKLFWGNNLPSVTPPGKHYTPLWDDDELLLIREILGDGLRLFRKHVKVAKS